MLRGPEHDSGLVRTDANLASRLTWIRRRESIGRNLGGELGGDWAIGLGDFRISTALLPRIASEACARALGVKHACTLFVVVPTWAMNHMSFYSHIQSFILLFVRNLSADDAVNVRPNPWLILFILQDKQDMHMGKGALLILYSPGIASHSAKDFPNYQIL